MSQEINFALPEHAKKLKKLYLKAVKEKAESFNFRGQEVVTNYAKYLVEHLETNVYKQKLENIR